MSPHASRRCLVRGPHLPNVGLPLFCLPYAGAGAGMYRTWGERLAPAVDVMAVQLPGREGRFGEAAHAGMAPLVAEVADALQARSSRRYALFGHSMGALVAFELAHEMRRRGMPLPLLLVVSGHAAPHLARRRAPLHALPSEQFVEELRRLRGMPEEVLANEELMSLLLPRLRADFAVCETYVCPERPPLDCPLVAFGGRDDDCVAPAALSAWRSHTSGPFDMQQFEGGHFFVDQLGQEVTEALGTRLATTGKPTSGSYEPQVAHG